MKRSIRIGSAVAAALFAGAALADVTVFNRDNFNGPSMTLSTGSPDLKGSGFYDSISSIEVHSGRWEFCSLPQHRGDCRVLEPGRYARLPQALNHRIESVRQIDRVAYEPRVYEQRQYARDREYGAVELYSAPGFRGPSVALNRDAWNLERRGMDDRASSMIVNEGQWQVCSERGFDGFCRTFGPGQYPRLGGLEDRVTSLRRVG